MEDDRGIRGNDERERSIAARAKRGPKPTGRQKLLALALGTLCTLGVLETGVRVASDRLPKPLSNYLASCYENDAPTPLWDIDPRLDLRWPRAHVETVCALNGYRWHHRSDQLGFRNPTDQRRVDVAILGDSMVYGHGVEEPDTAVNRLRERLHLPVANLGVVAASPVDYLAYANHVVPRLRPRVAVVFVYRNDLVDLNRARTRDDIERFVATGRGRESLVLPPSYFRDARRIHDPVSPLVRFASHSRLFRLLRFHWLLNVLHTPVDFRRPFRAPKDDALGARYVRALLGATNDSLRRQGVRLVLAHMPNSRPRSWSPDVLADVAYRATRDSAAELGVPFFDPTRAFELPDRNPDVSSFLPGDFHLSARGNRRLAHELAAFLRREGLVPPR